MANPLDKIILDVTLWDGSGDKYVKATIKGDGVEVAYSPVVCPHIGLGQYLKKDNAIIFPVLVQHLSIVYEIFEDVAMTIKSNQHANASEHYIYSKEIVIDSDNAELIRVITSAMNELRTVNVELDLVEEETVQVIVDQRDTPDTIEIVIEEEAGIIISVETENEVSGTMTEENNITGNIGE